RDDQGHGRQHGDPARPAVPLRFLRPARRRRRARGLTGLPRSRDAVFTAVGGDGAAGMTRTGLARAGRRPGSGWPVTRRPVPGLAVARLAVPGLAVARLAVTGLTVSGLVRAGLAAPGLTRTRRPGGRRGRDGAGLDGIHDGPGRA